MNKGDAMGDAIGDGPYTTCDLCGALTPWWLDMIADEEVLCADCERARLAALGDDESRDDA